MLALPGGVRLTLLAGFPDPSRASPAVAGARRNPPSRRPPTCRRTGSRSATATCTASFPLAAYQNVYATEPGSAEMASAGRPLTERLICRARGPRDPRRPAGAAHRRLEPGAARTAVPGAVRRPGGHGPVGDHAPVGPAGRVVAVGTTVTRALETATDDDGVVRPRSWLDRPRARPRPAGADGHRAADRSARPRGEPPAAARGRGRARRSWTRPTARPSPSTTSGTSSATRCCSCRDALRRGRWSRACRSTGGRRGHDVHIAWPGTSTSRQHDARRVNRAPADVDVARQPAAVARSRRRGARPAAVSVGTSPSARPSARHWLASESVAIAHSGPFPHPAGLGDRRDHGRRASRAVRTPARCRVRSPRPRPAGSPAGGRRRVLGRRRQRPAGGQPGERRGQQHRGRRSTTTRSPSTRGSPVPCHRARTASTSAVHAGSARRTAGTTSAPGGSTRPSAAAPGTRAATAACTRSATRPVCRGDYCSPAGAPVTLTIHAMPYLSVHMPKLSPHGAFSSGMVTLPPCTSPSQ